MIQQYNELEQALESDDPRAVVEKNRQLLDQYETVRPEETALEKLALVLRRQQASDGDTPEPVNQYLRTRTETEQLRGSISEELIQYIEGERNAEAVVDAVQSARKTERILRDEKDALRSAADGVDLDPILTLLGPERINVPVGKEIAESYELTNLGGGTEEPVSVSLSGIDVVSVDPKSVSPLERDETVTLTVSGTPSESRSQRGDIRAEAGDFSEALSLVIEAIQPTEYISQAIQRIETLQTDLRDRATEYLDEVPPDGEIKWEQWNEGDGNGDNDNSARGSGRNKGPEAASAPRGRKTRGNNAAQKGGRKKADARFLLAVVNALKSVKAQLREVDSILEARGPRKRSVAPRLNAVEQTLEAVQRRLNQRPLTVLSDREVALINDDIMVVIELTDNVANDQPNL